MDEFIKSNHVSLQLIFCGADPPCIGPGPWLTLEAACSAPWAHRVLLPPLLQILPNIPAEALPSLPKSHQKNVPECTVALPQFHQMHLYKHESIVILHPFTVILYLFASFSIKYLLAIDFLGHALIYCANGFGNLLWSPQIPMLSSTTACEMCTCGYTKLYFELLHFLCNWFLRSALLPVGFPLLTVLYSTFGHGPTEALLTHSHFNHPWFWLTASLASLLCPPTQLCSPSLHCHQPAQPQASTPLS